MLTKCQRNADYNKCVVKLINLINVGKKCNNLVKKAFSWTNFLYMTRVMWDLKWSKLLLKYKEDTMLKFVWLS